MRRLLLALALCLATGCASSRALSRPEPASVTPPRSPAPRQAGRASAEEAPSTDSLRRKVVARARALVGKRRIVLGGKRYPRDCTGVVLAAYEGQGFSLYSRAKRRDNGVKAFFRYVEAHGHAFEGGHPMPGDLVFFRDTYDVNRDGRMDDGLTHVAIVEGEDADGTLSLIHHLSRGVMRSRMNLRHPDVHKDPATGKVLNDYLRLAKGRNPRKTTGQLFVSFGVLFERPSQAVARR